MGLTSTSLKDKTAASSFARPPPSLLLAMVTADIRESLAKPADCALELRRGAEKIVDDVMTLLADMCHVTLFQAQIKSPGVQSKEYALF